MTFSYQEVADEVSAAVQEVGDTVTFTRRSKGTPADGNKWWREDDQASPGSITTSAKAVRDDSELKLSGSGVMEGKRKYIVAAAGVASTYRDVLEDFDVILDGGEEWRITGVPEKIRGNSISVLYVFSCEKVGRKGYTV